MKIILEGDFTISNLAAERSEAEGGKEAEGGIKIVEAGPGDVFYFEKGSRIRFETAKGGLAFYVGQVRFPVLLSLPVELSLGRGVRRLGGCVWLIRCGIFREPRALRNLPPEDRGGGKAWV